MSEKQQAIINKAKPTVSIFSSNFSIPENVLAQELYSEVVLLNMDSESYYSLNPVGSQIWLLLNHSDNVDAVIQQLLRVYVVNEAALRQDITVLLEELVREDLLIPYDGKKNQINLTRNEGIKESNQAEPENFENSLTYELPLLRKHGKVSNTTLTIYSGFPLDNPFFPATDIS